MSKPVIEYQDYMQVTLGKPAWVFPVGAVHFEQTGPVTIMDYVGARWPTFETADARYEPARNSALPYPNNQQSRPS